jgi:long-chain acyl-CoA synthetase
MGSTAEIAGFVCEDRWCGSEELFERVARAATVLDRHGVGAGDRVAVMLRNDFPFLEATYGAQLLGAVPVPVNWHYRRDEAGFILIDSAAKAVVVHADLLGEIAGVVPGGCAVLVADVPEDLAAACRIAAVKAPPRLSWDAAVREAVAWPHPPLPAAASMIYTSGTTGRPKGIRRRRPLDPAAPGFAATLAVLGIAPGMRTVVCGPLYHSAPNVFGQLAGRMGGLVVLQPRFDAEQLLAMIERYSISALHLVPTMMIRMLRLPAEVRARYDVSSVSCVAHAAAPCPPQIKRAFIDWFGPVVNEYYGGSETTAVVACSSEEWLAHPGTVGRALVDCEVRIYSEGGTELGPGEVGDIYLWNAGVGDFTYEGRDQDRTAIERDGLVTVGDMGYLDEDGYLYLCDRRRDMIIAGGVNIYPAEIEAVLSTHPDVADCAVIGVPHEEFGESVLAIVQPGEVATRDGEGIRAFLRERIADYKVPRRIEFTDQLPREDSGKVFKQRLRSRYWPTGRSI